MVDEISLAGPIVLGLIGVLVAVLDRGYLRFKEEQINKPELKFGGAYLVNFLISSGASAAIIITVIPSLVSGLGSVTGTGAAAVSILQLILGYTLAYTMLSKLNTSTERKIMVFSAEKKLGKQAQGLDKTADTTSLMPDNKPK